MLKKISPFLFLIAIALIFFYQIFQKLIPLPMDALVGNYFPWLDYKWGYIVGVPVKNSLISDVFSALYPWKALSMDLIKNLEWPLWNPYSFSGMPLLANFQSAALYPLNFLMILFGNLNGWVMMVVLQPMLALVFTYLFLKELGLNKLSSVFGAIIFSFSGFMSVWLEFNNAAQTGLWLPIMLYFLERFTKTFRIIFLSLFSITIFCLITAGNAQIAIYSLIFSFCYVLFKKLPAKKIVLISTFFLLGISLAAAQLIPTYELFRNSVRPVEGYISQTNFGLLPWENLATFLYYDFFGNPVTQNYHGFNNYHETAGYFGLIPVFGIIFALFYPKFKKPKFFIWSLIISILLTFDNPVSHWLYGINIPILFTGYASRILFLVDFSAAVVSAFVFSFLITKLKSRKYFGFIPYIIIFVTILDLFRFGLKYNPFTSPKFVYPDTLVLEFLKKNTGNFRIERYPSEVFPPNTWISYKLMSPSGYDPLSLSNYAHFFNVYNGHHPENGVSRYALLEKADSSLIDLAGVKYLVTKKEDKSVTNPKYKAAFEDKSVVVLENMSVSERVSLFDNFMVVPDTNEALDKLYKGFDFKNKIILDQQPESANLKKNPQDKININVYSANKIQIQTQTLNNTLFMLTDTFYPGWQATVDGNKTQIFLADGIYRAVLLPAGNHQVEFIYFPDSFKWGLIVSSVSLLIVITCIFCFKNIYEVK